MINRSRAKTHETVFVAVPRLPRECSLTRLRFASLEGPTSCVAVCAALTVAAFVETAHRSDCALSNASVRAKAMSNTSVDASSASSFPPSLSSRIPTTNMSRSIISLFAPNLHSFEIRRNRHAKSLTDSLACCRAP